MMRMVKHFIREPLLLFFALGAALFAVYGLINANVAAPASQITVTRADLLQFMQYQAKAFDEARFAALFDQLSTEDREQLIADYVREEALYREAKALGLDRNDYVARRRLIQQLEFITQGFIEARLTLSDDELETYYENHKVAYAEPAKVLFSHVFFSIDRHGAEKAGAMAQQKLHQLNERRTPFHEATAHGDRPLYHVNYVRKERDLIASHFGETMAQTLFSLDPDPSRWRGPYRSAYGFHLVLLTERIPAQTPTFEDVKPRVEVDAMGAYRQRKLNEAIDDIVAAYEVRLIDDRSVNGKKPDS